MSNTSKNTNLQLSIDQPDQLLTMASDLSKFIKENKLFHNIQGKAYVNVEGWQYAGARLGILPSIEQIENHSTEKEIKYSATVSLINIRTGAKVGSGYAICSNQENGKKNYQEFAIASMAQTRSVGKAYRNMLAWIIRAAGYEPTPAEEMDYEKPEEKPSQQPVAITAKLPEKSALIKLKTELLLTMNNAVITKEERNRMIESINDMTPERIKQAIAKAKDTIAERSAQKQSATVAA